MRTRHRKHLRHWWQWALVATVLVVVVAGIAGAAYYFVVQGRVQDPGIETAPRKQEAAPFNALLVGSDSRSGLTPEEQARLSARDVLEDQRADTLILAHVDPAAPKVTMVQFPRDLYVEILGEGEDRINSALERGPARLHRAVAELTGLEINHYVQVNLAGFKQVVDALGGVDVCITEPIPFDRQTGLEVTEEELGLVHFNGEEAIRFVRSRSTFREGDFARIRNQQKFLAAAIDKALSTGTLLNPVRIRSLVDALGDNLVIDRRTTLLGLRELAGHFRSLEPGRYEAYTVPNLGIAMVGEKSVVLPDPRAMRVMFQALARNESPDDADGVPNVDPSTIRVAFYNSTGREGAATRAVERLTAAIRTGGGTIKVVHVGNVRPQARGQTVIRHRPAARDKALLISGAVPDARLVKGRVRGRADVEIIVGKRFRAQRVVQIVPLPIPQPAEPPAACR